VISLATAFVVGFAFGVVATIILFIATINSVGRAESDVNGDPERDSQSCHESRQ
jgi:hypothetical protein